MTELGVVLSIAESCEALSQYVKKRIFSYLTGQERSLLFREGSFIVYAHLA